MLYTCVITNLAVPMYCLISGMIVVVVGLDKFILVDAAAKTQEIRHLIFRFLQDFRDHRKRNITIT